MLKRWISLILCLVMVLSMVPVPALAEDAQSDDENEMIQMDDSFISEEPSAGDSSAEKKPVEDSPSGDLPSEDTPMEDIPTEDDPSEDTPTEDTPTEDTPTEDTPTEDTPTEDTPAEDSPEEDNPALTLVFTGEKTLDEKGVAHYALTASTGDTITLEVRAESSGSLCYQWQRLENDEYRDLTPEDGFPDGVQDATLQLTVTEETLRAEGLYRCAVTAVSDGEYLTGYACFTILPPEIQAPEEPPEEDNGITETSIEIHITAPDEPLYVGDTVQLTAEIFPETADASSLIWSSSDETIATVDETGLVTALDAGEVTISVIAGEQEEASASIDFWVVMDNVAMVTLTPETYFSSGYNAEKAVEFAMGIWENGKYSNPDGTCKNDSQCANFVSDCLAAGGLDITKSLTGYLSNELHKRGYQYYYLDGNTSDGFTVHKALTPGDIIFYCVENDLGRNLSEKEWYSCGKSDAPPHVVICTNVNGSKAYACGTTSVYKETPIKNWLNYPIEWYRRGNIVHYAFFFDMDGSGGGTSSTPVEKPALTNSMIVDDYLTYWAYSRETINTLIVPKNGSVDVWRLPWTDSGNTSKHGTSPLTAQTTANLKLTNHVGNVWYRTAEGGFVYSGDTVLLSRDMSAEDYLTYFSESSESAAGTVTPSSGSATIWKLPWTDNGTATQTGTLTLPQEIDRKVVNHVGNIWYRLTDGGFVSAGSVTLSDTVKTLTVTLNPNGGSCSTTSVSLTVGGTYGSLPTPTRSGYSFTGWYTARESGDKISSTTKVTVSGTQTLYAHWAASSTVKPSFSALNVTKITSTTAYFSAKLNWNAANKPKAWGLKLSTSPNSITHDAYSDTISDSILAIYNPIPISVDFGREAESLIPDTQYYYTLWVKDSNDVYILHDETGSFKTASCSHSYSSTGVCAVCGSLYDWTQGRTVRSVWVRPSSGTSLELKSIPYSSGTTLGTVSRIQAAALILNHSGEEWLEAQYNGQTCYIRKSQAAEFVPAEDMFLCTIEIQLYPGDTHTPGWVFEPDNATDQTLLWSSSNSCVTVSAEGTITAVSPGTAVITAVSNDNPALSDSYTVRVTEPPETRVQSVSVSLSGEVHYVGETIQATAVVLPESAVNQGVSWESSDPSVATVSPEGLVTTVTPGTTIIRAVSNDNKDIFGEYSLTVSPILISYLELVGPESGCIEAGYGWLPVTILYPSNATDDSYSISITNGTGEAVFSSDGYIYGLRPGTVTVTVTANDEGKCSNSLTVTVVESTGSPEQVLRSAIESGATEIHINRSFTFTENLTIPSNVIFFIHETAPGIPTQVTVPENRLIINNGRIILAGADAANSTASLWIQGAIQNNGMFMVFDNGRLEADEGAVIWGDTRAFCYGSGYADSHYFSSSPECGTPEIHMRQGILSGTAIVSDNITLSGDLYIPAGSELHIYENESGDNRFVIPEGVQVVNDGTIVVFGATSGTELAILDIRGTLDNNGTLDIEKNGLVNVSGSIDNSGFLLVQADGRMEMSGTISNSDGKIELADGSQSSGLDSVIESDLRAAIDSGDDFYILSSRFTLTSDLSIPNGFGLFFADGAQVIIPNGITLTNNGDLYLKSGRLAVSPGGTLETNSQIHLYGGKLIMDGNLTGNGIIRCWYGECNLEEDITGISRSRLWLTALVEEEDALQDVLTRFGDFLHIDVSLSDSTEITLTRDLTIPENARMILPYYVGDRVKLIIPKNVTLTNNGYLEIYQPTQVQLQGKLVNNNYVEAIAGTVEITGTVDDSKSMAYLTDWVSTPRELVSALSSEANLIRLEADILISQNITVPEGKQLIVETGRTLTIAAGYTLTNNGHISLLGTLEVKGNFAGTGAEIFEDGILIPSDIPHYTYGQLMESVEIIGPETVLPNSQTIYNIKCYPLNTWWREATLSIGESSVLASINDDTGLLSVGGEPGKVIIHAIATDGGGASADFEVTVRQVPILTDGPQSLRPGQTGTFQAWFETDIESDIIWEWDKSAEQFASIHTSGSELTVTAFRNLTEVQSLTFTAKATNGDASEKREVRILPTPLDLIITGVFGNTVTGQTLSIDLNTQTALSFHAVTLPSGSDSRILWKSSDTKGLYGSYQDEGDGTLSVELNPNAACGTITLTATDTLNKKTAVVKLTTRKLTTELTPLIEEGISGEMSVGEMTPEQKAAALVSGMRRRLSANLQGLPNKPSVTWTIPEEYAPYATVRGNGIKNGVATADVTARNVSHPVQIPVFATSVDNPDVKTEFWLWIVPRTVSVHINDSYGIDQTGKTVYFDLNSPPQNGLVFYANTLPSDAKDQVIWKTSDSKNLISTITVDDSGSITLIPTAEASPGKSTVLTATAADGTGKSAKVTVKFVKLPTGIQIVGAPEEISGKKSLTLKTDIQSNRTLSDKSVYWTLREQDLPYASITSSGKLTVYSTAEQGLEIQVTATAKATGHSDTKTIRILPDVDRSILLGFDGYDWPINGQSCVADPATSSFSIGSSTLFFGENGFNVNSRTIPTGENLVWSTSNKSIATVNSGLISFVKNTKTGTFNTGKVTITAATVDGRIKANFQINVVNRVQAVAISGLETMTGGSRQTLSAGLTPSKPTNSKVSWRIISGSDFASISSSGVLTANNVTYSHTIQVTATSLDTGVVSEPFSVTILPASNNIRIMRADDADSEQTPVTGKTIVIDVGETHELDLTATVFPLESSQSIIWKSSSPAIATVNENGHISIQYDSAKGCYKTGKVTITATSTDRTRKTAKVILNIVKLMDSITMPETAAVGGGKSITIPAIPDAFTTNKKLIWSLSGDTTWATIRNGKLSAKNVTSPKTVFVIATAADGSGTYNYCWVTIYPVVTKIAILKDGNTDITGTTLDFTDSMVLHLSNTPNSAYSNWTAKTSNAAIQAIVDNGNHTLTLIRDPEKTIRRNSPVTITVTAADGSGKSARFTVIVRQ